MLVKLWVVFFILLVATWGGAQLLAHGQEVGCDRARSCCDAGFHTWA
jgi:hypothetical protein